MAALAPAVNSNLATALESPTLHDQFSDAAGFASSALPADELRWLAEHFSQDLPADDFMAEMDYLSWVEDCRRQEAVNDSLDRAA